jgi:hypothetical protein
LEGDFHEDIRGSDIVLKNDEPTDRNISLERDGTYMEGFAPVQRGTVGDMTAGLPLGLWTEEFARHLKAQLEVVWRENGFAGIELDLQPTPTGDREFCKGRTARNRIILEGY